MSLVVEEAACRFEGQDDDYRVEARWRDGTLVVDFNRAVTAQATGQGVPTGVDRVCRSAGLRVHVPTGGEVVVERAVAAQAVEERDDGCERDVAVEVEDPPAAMVFGNGGLQDRQAGAA